MICVLVHQYELMSTLVSTLSSLGSLLVKHVTSQDKQSALLDANTCVNTEHSRVSSCQARDITTSKFATRATSSKCATSSLIDPVTRSLDHSITRSLDHSSPRAIDHLINVGLRSSTDESAVALLSHPLMNQSLHCLVVDWGISRSIAQSSTDLLHIEWERVLNYHCYDIRPWHTFSPMGLIYLLIQYGLIYLLVKCMTWM